MKVKLKKNLQKKGQQLLSFIFEQQIYPIALMGVVLCILFVVFRMKNVELDYSITKYKNILSKVKIEQKELEAKKAKILSIPNLTSWAEKFEFKRPGRGQIIVIPN